MAPKKAKNYICTSFSDILVRAWLSRLHTRCIQPLEVEPHCPADTTPYSALIRRVLLVLQVLLPLILTIDFKPKKGSTRIHFRVFIYYEPEFVILFKSNRGCVDSAAPE